MNHACIKFAYIYALFSLSPLRWGPPKETPCMMRYHLACSKKADKDPKKSLSTTNGASQSRQERLTIDAKC